MQGLGCNVSRTRVTRMISPLSGQSVKNKLSALLHQRSITSKICHASLAHLPPKTMYHAEGKKSRGLGSATGLRRTHRARSFVSLQFFLGIAPWSLADLGVCTSAGDIYSTPSSASPSTTTPTFFEKHASKVPFFWDPSLTHRTLLHQCYQQRQHLTMSFGEQRAFWRVI